MCNLDLFIIYNYYYFSNYLLFNFPVSSLYHNPEAQGGNMSWGRVSVSTERELSKAGLLTEMVSQNS